MKKAISATLVILFLSLAAHAQQLSWGAHSFTQVVRVPPYYSTDHTITINFSVYPGYRPFDQGATFDGQPMIHLSTDQSNMWYQTPAGHTVYFTLSSDPDEYYYIYPDINYIYVL